MNASRGRSRNRVKNRAVSARCGRGSRGLGFVLVALWGNGAPPSVLKCHETGAILCGYGLVGNFQTRETSEFQALGCPIRDRHDMENLSRLPRAIRMPPDSMSVTRLPTSIRKAPKTEGMRSNASM